MSTAITSFSLEDGKAWPNITLPDFDKRAATTEGLAGVELLAFVPIIASKAAAQWEEYAWEHQGWIAKDWSHHDDPVDAGAISPKLYYDGPNTGDTDANKNQLDIHTPIWQVPVPHNASVVNFDFYHQPQFRDRFNDVIETRKRMISGVLDISYVLEKIRPDSRHGSDPSSVIYEPVFNSFDVNEANVSGFVLAGLPWTFILSDILPSGKLQARLFLWTERSAQSHILRFILIVIGTNGILVEIHITCGSPVFTYELNGREAEYIGEGLINGLGLAQHMRSYPFAESTRYFGDNDNDYFCAYNLHIMPTKTFEQAYYTNGPALFAAVIITVFLVTALVFAGYDYTVYRRQTKLLQSAERTNAIVSSLFPKDVRDRIMAEAEAQARQDAPGGAKFFGGSAKNQLKGFLNEDDGKDGVAVESIFKTMPIADLFPEVTVMFADLVGFTAWSSMREPAQVFTLLETIYHEFDQIAKRRRVFKVETVGDCYVAVAGLPEFRKDHATVMVSSAN